MDEELKSLTLVQLADEIRRLRAGIREHRDASNHGLCWHHPKLWGLLPEQTDPQPTVPDWPQFLRGCVHYRQSLDDQLPGAPRSAAEFEEKGQPGARGSRLAVVETHLQTQCSCCGNRYPAKEIDHLQRHAETALCDGCINLFVGRQRQKLERVAPVLATENLGASKEFWAKGGFEIESFGDDFAIANREGVELRLMREHPPAPDRSTTYSYLYVRGVDSVHAEWRAAELPVSDVRDEPWGMREFNVLDPGGNRVRVGQNKGSTPAGPATSQST